MIDNIEKEFNSLQSYFNEGKKFLLGKTKNIKLAIENYDSYYLKINKTFNDLKSNITDNNCEENEKLKNTYIFHLIRLSKIFLMIPYFYKSKIVCEKILEIDKDNIQIIPTYIKCLHYFKEYSLITNILNNIKNEDEIIKDLKNKNEERIKESKGIYNLKKIYENFKKTNNYNLDIAEYKSDKISIKPDKIKGLIVVANEDISKGEILISEKAIEYTPIIDKNFKNYVSKEIWHKSLRDQIDEKIKDRKEDNPEIFEIYDGNNGNLSLEKRKENYLKNISKNNNIIYSEDQLTALFSDSYSTKLFLYDELSVASGLFYYTSFISHSCNPNLMIFGIGNFIFSIADKNIKKNEELTTFYIENDKVFTQRQNDLFLHYGFKCDCSLCQIEKEYFEKYNDVKSKTNNYILQVIDMCANMSNYNPMDFYTKQKEVEDFIEKNEDKIRNFEKGLLYYNLYFIWADSKTNYNYLAKALDFFEKETTLNFNTMIYYCLLKMYKMNYIFNKEKCEEIKNKIRKLLIDAFGNNQNEFVEAIIDDIIKLNTSEDDPDLNLFKETKLTESQNLINN